MRNILIYRTTRNILNKYAVRALFIAVPALFAACESFLDLKPTNALLADNAVYDAKTARALVNSAYSSLKGYTTGSAITLGVLPADNVFFGGSQSQNIELDNNAFTVTNSAIVGAYSSNYSIINVANWAISEIPKVKDDNGFAAGEADKLIGEVYFIRAFAYFNLVRSWGGVQLQLNPTTDLSSLGSIPRSSQDDTYKRILDDLETAEELLPADDDATRNKLQRAIVKAFRAKVHLYAKQFEQAESYAAEVIANPKYELVKPYSEFFQPPFLSRESVFEISATSNNAGTSGSAWFPASGTPRGSYEFRPTNGIITLLNDPAKGGSRNALIVTRGSDTYGNLYHTTSPNINPAYVIRIADLYLIRAEARVRKANPDYRGAIADLNAVRDRADADLFPEGSTDKNAILQAIWDERRIEFAFEADRWYDLVRTEQAETVLGVNRNFWLFPIPQADVLADPDLNGENNPGY
jgi:tetratricopeptide (TPR) repeat protein